MSMREVTGKLALGTVQFGLPYGIANQQGQVSVEEVGQILERAREAGEADGDARVLLHGGPPQDRHLV